MEEKIRSAKVHALYYGLITGGAVIIYSLILYIANLHMNRVLGFVSMVLLIGGMVWGALEYRKVYLNGFMPYAKAFTICFMIGLFASLLNVIYTYFFAAFIHPEFTQEILEQARQRMLDSGQQMSDEQMEQAMVWTERFTSPVMIAIWGLISNVFFSVIIALIAAIFLKKEDKSLSAVS